MKILSKIRKKINEYSSTMEAAKLVVPFLEKGCYRVRPFKLEKKLGLPFIRVRGNSDKAVSGIDSVSFYFGGWSGKTVALLGDKVYSFYKKDRLSDIEHLAAYYDQINYPKCEIFRISTEELYTVTERAAGKQCYDEDHIIMLAKSLISYNTSAVMDTSRNLSEYGLDGVPFYLQHGDLTASNAIWSDDSHYTLIDFDTIGVFPCFYDVLRLMLLDHDTDGMRIYTEGLLDDAIASFMTEKHIGENLQVFKDKCLAAFILYTYTFWHTDKVVENKLPDTYTKSRNAVIALKAKA